ncbi:MULTISPECIES: FadR/GntR family transcriptional regulator [unclassified Mesorhizobium]|uniref:FadR/GntR family transcriptional regulator n=1 Tax=unclassified Mesorhizobium TaxID=325217 RepID=UPI00095B5CFB|nr:MULTISPECIES: FadR/GntR family transcriptional regulator [unclassified Mesorhizobium]MBN9254225.1 FadR family transcriptional regulator [Mesorhizobium sp.]OJX76425.1 MAG: GntR family transcriptional regulator [Mesorhizobium sp. 65-26]
MKNKKLFSATRLPRFALATAGAASGLHATVVDQIGLRIVQGDFPPGEALPTADDSTEMLGVSRTVLREAIKVLAGKGLVESRPRTGTRVRPRADWNFLDPDVLSWRYAAGVSADDVKALFELRRAIEPMSAALAAQRATPEQVADLNAALAEMEEVCDDGERFAKPDLLFHQTILRMTGNELIGSLAALVETALIMSFRLSNDNPGGQRHSLPLHREVARKIAAGDGAGAQKALLVLIDNAEEDVRRSVENRNRRRAEREQTS